MKKKISTSIILGLLLIGIFIYNNDKENHTTEQAMSKMEVITTINFPSLGSSISDNAKFSIEDSIKNKVHDQTDKVFKYKDDIKIDDKVNILKKVFSLKDGSVNDHGSYRVIENAERTIRVNNDGTYIYHSKIRDNESPNVISDNDAKNNAEKFLTQNNLLIDGFTQSSITYETKTSATNPSDSKVIKKMVYFTRKINGKETSGVSRIVVGIGQDGTVSDIYSAAKELIPGSQNIRIKNSKKAYDDLINLNGMINMNDDVTKVNITHVELAYWEDSTPNSSQTHIQPVYKFIGETYNILGVKGTFNGYVSAIPDELTTTIDENNIITESTQKYQK